nr:unnamed protein product [Callosobruchus analis]
MDSLMGAEIKQTLERNYDLVLSAQEIRALTFGKLVELGSGGGGSTPAATSTSKDKNVQFDMNSEIMPTKTVIEMPNKGKENIKHPCSYCIPSKV